MLENIGFQSITTERAKQNHTNLKRCELVLTDKCNFKCVYCKGLPFEKEVTSSKEDALAIIDGWIEHGLEHANFSGGEPMCDNNIFEYVDRLAKGGVKTIGLSTNGSFSYESYKRLVDLGATHFAISIDDNSSDFDKIAVFDGAWNRVVSSLQKLSKISYVTASIVLMKGNVERAPEIIEFVSSLGVQDIRFSSAVQYNKLIENLGKVDSSILDRHPILKYRVTNLVTRRANMRGGNTNKRCWIPLDDMVVCNGFHYPCSMQLRENGVNIGTTNKSMKEIIQERKQWSESFDCTKDQICRDCCMDFMIDYNSKCGDLSD